MGTQNLCLLAVLLAPCLAACATDCSSIGCGFYTVEVTGPEGQRLDDGAYELAIEVDSFMFETTCTLPADAEGAASRPPPCEPSRLDSTPAGRYLSVSALDGVITILASREDLREGDVSGIGGPDQLSVVVASDGDQLADADFHPQYSRDREFYGDPECGFCDTAPRERITLSR